MSDASGGQIHYVNHRNVHILCQIMFNLILGEVLYIHIYQNVLDQGTETFYNYLYVQPSSQRNILYIIHITRNYVYIFSKIYSLKAYVFSSPIYDLFKAIYTLVYCIIFEYYLLYVHSS